LDQVLGTNAGSIAGSAYILIVIANALYLLLGFLERQYEAVA
jgi:hypothetical protein